MRSVLCSKCDRYFRPSDINKTCPHCGQKNHSLKYHAHDSWTKKRIDLINEYGDMLLTKSQKKRIKKELGIQ